MARLGGQQSHERIVSQDPLGRLASATIGDDDLRMLFPRLFPQRIQAPEQEIASRAGGDHYRNHLLISRS
jgi:hypothetical protein